MSSLDNIQKKSADVLNTYTKVYMEYKKKKDLFKKLRDILKVFSKKYPNDKKIKEFSTDITNALSGTKAEKHKVRESIKKIMAFKVIDKKNIASLINLQNESYKQIQGYVTSVKSLYEKFSKIAPAAAEYVKKLEPDNSALAESQRLLASSKNPNTDLTVLLKNMQELLAECHSLKKEAGIKIR